MMDNYSKSKIKESSFVRSPKTIKKQLEKRSKHVNARISFDLCPEIETALKEKGLLSKFEMNSKNGKSIKSNEKIDNEVQEIGLLSNSFEKSKSLYEFEDLEAVCNTTLEVLSETQLNDVIEPSGFWNNSIFDNPQSPTRNLVYTQQNKVEQSDSTANSFETACVSNNSSYFTAAGISVIDEKDKVNSISAVLDDSLIILSDSNDERFELKSNNGRQQLDFNDTLEEIEFIMTKGKDYIQNVVEKVTFSVQQETDLDKENMSKSKLPTPTSKFKDRQHDTFKKPVSSILSLKKIDFNHIRSPIGEYIKKTIKSPMILSAKPDSVKKPKQIAFDSYDSIRRNPSTIGTKNLPKKAYISSDNKKYTDDRPPVTVPGGPKIQNHLKSSRLMGVIKHEGKIRTISKSKTISIPETSFSNLSVASGDVSFYTLKK